MVMVFFSSSKEISMRGSKERVLRFSCVSVRYESLSSASDALLISSRKKISLKNVSLNLKAA